MSRQLRSGVCNLSAAEYDALQKCDATTKMAYKRLRKTYIGAMRYTPSNLIRFNSGSCFFDELAAVTNYYAELGNKHNYAIQVLQNLLNYGLVELVNSNNGTNTAEYRLPLAIPALKSAQQIFCKRGAGTGGGNTKRLYEGRNNKNNKSSARKKIIANLGWIPGIYLYRSKYQQHASKDL